MVSANVSVDGCWRWRRKAGGLAEEGRRLMEVVKEDVKLVGVGEDGVKGKGQMGEGPCDWLWPKCWELVKGDEGLFQARVHD